MSPRKKKTISDEDAALFHTALKDAKPLKKRHRMSAEPSKPPRIFVPLPHYPAEPTYSERPAPFIGGHADAHLRRGRLDPEARIDLHGMTQGAAYRTLLRFLIDAQAQEKSLVLVITGKGGVLRAQLPLWLGQPDLRGLVGGLREAHVRHGGAGAFYVQMRKHRRAR
jgi:DNA-nicking Smr family endonuclease